MTSPRLMGAIYALAGTYHLVNPRLYLRMMPSYLPAPRLLVFVSGVAEILLGLGVMYPPTRAIAAWGLVALLIAVFPANVEMLRTRKQKWPRIPAWVLWARLPLQGVLVYWALELT